MTRLTQEVLDAARVQFEAKLMEALAARHREHDALIAELFKPCKVGEVAKHMDDWNRKVKAWNDRLETADAPR